MTPGTFDIQQLRRVVVIGTSCSGKTTFASRLAGILDSKHIELDAIHWLPHWTPRPAEEFQRMVGQEVDAENWVVDGNYGMARGIVWPRATALIWQ